MKWLEKANEWAVEAAFLIAGVGLAAVWVGFVWQAIRWAWGF